VKTNHHIFVLNCNKGIKKQMPIKQETGEVATKNFSIARRWCYIV